MELGTGSAASRQRRWAMGYLTVAIIAGLVCLADAAGTTYALLTPGYVFEENELAGEIAVFTGTLLLAVFCVARVHSLGRRHLAQVERQDLETWLPPPAKLNGEGQVDLAVETARLRPLALRALGMAVLWLVVLAGAVAGFVVLEQASDRLLVTGTRVSGEVLGVHNPRRGSPSISVGYEVNGTPLVADIDRDSDRQYRVGEHVTVVYDPADPSRVRTSEEPNNEGFWFVVGVVGVFASFAGIPMSLVAAAKWRRRHRAVQSTGWRVASVTVVPDYPVRKGRHMPDIHVEYRDGSRITLRAASSSHGSVPLKDRPNRRAWIGGTGRHMVVLFPHGRWRTPPYAVPAHALDTRHW